MGITQICEADSPSRPLGTCASGSWKRVWPSGCLLQCYHPMAEPQNKSPMDAFLAESKNNITTSLYRGASRLQGLAFPPYQADWWPRFHDLIFGLYLCKWEGLCSPPSTAVWSHRAGGALGILSGWGTLHTWDPSWALHCSQQCCKVKLKR